MCQGEHWNERDALLLANPIFFPHCFFSVAEGGIYHFVQEGKIPAIFSTVSSMTCNHCSCQRNRTLVQLCIWLRLSRNHFTPPPPLIRSKREGGRTLLLQQLYPFFTHRGTANLLHAGGCCGDLLRAALQFPGSAGARWSWHRSSPATDTCACSHLCLFSQQFNTCSLLRHHHSPFQKPSRGHL